MTQPLNFDSFQQADWISYAWDSIDYDVLTIDQQRDLGLAETPHSYRADDEKTITRHTPTIADSRFDSISVPTVSSQSDLDQTETAELITLAYSLKHFIEESPHPENTNVRQLSHILKELHHRGLDISTFSDGSLVDVADTASIF